MRRLPDFRQEIGINGHIVLACADIDLEFDPIERIVCRIV
jgi:hypothetical protein